MKKLKFRAYDIKNKTMIPHEKLFEKNTETPFVEVCQNENYETSQFVGRQDGNGVDVYTHDILELHITSELMESGFRYSNLGKVVAEESLTDVICVLKDNKYLETPYEVYFKKDGKYVRDKKELPEIMAYGEDITFPMYLCEKGAVVIGNIFQNNDLIK